MSRVYEAWRRTDATQDSEAARPGERAQPEAGSAEAAAVPSKGQRPEDARATSLFPLRESLRVAEAPASDGDRTLKPWPVASDSTTRNLSFEELLRDIALDEQRMNL